VLALWLFGLDATTECAALLVKSNIAVSVLLPWTVSSVMVQLLLFEHAVKTGGGCSWLRIIVQGCLRYQLNRTSGRSI